MQLLENGARSTGNRPSHIPKPDFPGPSAKIPDAQSYASDFNVKTLAIFAVLVLVAVGFAVFVHKGSQKPDTSKPAPFDVYEGLRNMALQHTRAKLGLPPTSAPTEPWGVLMDWGVEHGTATVVAFSDGSASIYLSNGGGFLGGGESHESVQNAAKRMVTIAAEFQRLTIPTKTYPLPRRGEITFYLLTDSGIFMATAPEAELKSHRHPFSKLAEAGMDLITQYRLINDPAAAKSR